MHKSLHVLKECHIIFLPSFPWSQLYDTTCISLQLSHRGRIPLKTYFFLNTCKSCLKGCLGCKNEEAKAWTWKYREPEIAISPSYLIFKERGNERKRGREKKDENPWTTDGSLFTSNLLLSQVRTATFQANLKRSNWGGGEKITVYYLDHHRHISCAMANRLEENFMLSLSRIYLYVNDQIWWFESGWRLSLFSLNINSDQVTWV